MKKAVNRLIPRSRKLGSTVVKKLDINSIQDFYIMLSDPHKLYFPGDQIKGEIFLTLNKNLQNVSIDLGLAGTIKVKHSLTTSSLRSKKKILFNHIIRIYPGEDRDTITNEDASDEYHDLNNGLTKGQHIFPFVAQLPKENIYTSISFEKGSIGYKLKAFIGEINAEDDAPLFTCEKLLNVIKPINVAALPNPKIKTLIVKYPTLKLRKTISQTSTTNSSSISVISQDNLTPSLPSPESYVPNKAPIIEDDKSRIKLSVEIPNLGYLRGELIPVKISLQHIKRVSNLNGIIITLIRVCNVDSGPDGPIQSFRKDLSQTIAPLFVDPNTFKADINSSVRVPADAFPTITGNHIITFQYSIEVIVILSNSKGIAGNFQGRMQDDEDLNGIASQTQNSMSALINVLSNVESPTEYPLHGINSLTSKYIFNVDKLKRMKNVLTLSTEVVVGTKRKERQSGDIRTRRNLQSTSTLAETPVSDSSSNNQSTHMDYIPPLQSFTPPVNTSLNELIVSANVPSNLTEDINVTTPSPISGESAQLTLLRQEPPAIPDFDNLTEKQILQLRESSLLPSEPIYNHGETSIQPPPSVPNEQQQQRQLHIGLEGHRPPDRISRDPSFQSSSDLFDYVPAYQEYEKNTNQGEGIRTENARTELTSQTEGVSVAVARDSIQPQSEAINR